MGVRSVRLRLRGGIVVELGGEEEVHRADGELKRREKEDCGGDWKL